MSTFLPKFRNAIRDRLSVAKIDATRCAYFLDAMADIHGTPVEEPCPVPTWQPLLKAMRALEQQVALVREWDARAVETIYVGYGGYNSQFSLAEAAVILKGAVVSIEAAHPRPVGRPATAPRVYQTALGVGVAVYLILDRRPTAAREGLYEEILGLMLESITGKLRESDRIHQIASRVVKDPVFS